MHSDSEMVSVIMPSFNHELYVKDAILSVLSQTHKGIQLIVVDDCSTDSSPIIIRELASVYGFKYVIKARNEGVSEAINSGLELAEGKYICVIASDDVWMPEKISLQLVALSLNPGASICATRAKAIDATGSEVPSFSMNMRDSYDCQFSIVSFDDLFLGKATLTPSLLLERNLMPRLKSGHGVEDLPLWLDLTFTGRRIVIVNKKLIGYRMHQHNSHHRTQWLVKGHIGAINCYKNHPLYTRAIYEWRMFGALNLARSSKFSALIVLPKSLALFVDFRFYKVMLKLLFQWRHAS